MPVRSAVSSFEDRDDAGTGGAAAGGSIGITLARIVAALALALPLALAALALAAFLRALRS